jgi:hypothetical protein
MQTKNDKITGKFKQIIEKRLPIDASFLSKLVCRNKDFWNYQGEDNREEMESTLEYKILDKLLDFDSDIIPRFLTVIEQKSKKFGPLAQECIRGNIEMVCHMLEMKCTKDVSYDYDNYFKEGLCALADKYSKYVIPGGWQVHITTDEFIVGEECFTKFDEYQQYFSNDFVDIGYIAENPGAVRFPEYKQFFTHENRFIRLMAAKNPSAKNLPEFQQLLEDEDEEVRITAQNNSIAKK